MCRLMKCLHLIPSGRSPLFPATDLQEVPRADSQHGCGELGGSNGLGYSLRPSEAYEGVERLGVDGNWFRVCTWILKKVGKAEL